MRIPSVLVACLAPFAACGAPPPTTTSSTTPAIDGGFVRRQWSAPVADGAWRCAVADSAAAWREERERLGAAAQALGADWCAFATERAVVVQVPGAWRGQVVWTVGSEEDVDVLTLTPQRATEGATPGRVFVLAVTARAAELAVVVRVPGAAGQDSERTLGVFAGR